MPGGEKVWLNPDSGNLNNVKAKYQYNVFIIFSASLVNSAVLTYTEDQPLVNFEHTTTVHYTDE